MARTASKTPAAKTRTRAKPRAEIIEVIPNPAVEHRARKASATFDAFSDMGYGNVGISPDEQESFERLLRKFTSSTTWVYICVSRISTALAQTKFQIIRKNKESTPDAVERGPARGLKDLLINPNPWQSRYDFVENIGVCLLLTGNSFVEKAEMQGRRPRELYVLDPSAMSVIPDRKTKVGGYIYTMNGRQVKFDPEEIIHIKLAHPTNPFYGLSPLTAARISIDIDQGALEWNQNFMNRGGWPAGALETPNELGTDERRRLRNEIKAYAMVGKRAAGRLLLLSGGLKYHALAVSPKEMDWLSARRFSRDEILGIYGVPFAAAGLFSTEQTTARSAGVREQIRNFYQATVHPLLDGKILGALNRDLVPAFSDNLMLRPDMSSVPVMQEDMQRDYLRAQTFKVLVSAGWSINMALAELYPHIQGPKWGDVYWVNSQMVPVDDAEMPELPQSVTPPAGPPPKETEEGKLISRRLGVNGPIQASIERLLARSPDDHDDGVNKLVADMIVRGDDQSWDS